MWVYLYALPLLVIGRTPFAMIMAVKTLGWLSYLLCGFLVAFILHRWKRPIAPGLLLYAWNPVVLFELVANGHNDGWMVAGVLGALLAMSTGRVAAAFAALMLGILVKPVVAMLMPLLVLWVWRQPWPRRVRVTAVASGMSVSTALAIVCYAPFNGPNAAFLYGVRFSGLISTSLGWLSLVLLEPALGSAARQVVQLVAGVVFLALCLRVAWRMGKDEVHGAASFGDVLFWYLVVACFWLQPWYWVWIIPLAALVIDARRARRWLRFAFSFELIMLVIYSGAAWGTGLT